MIKEILNIINDPFQMSIYALYFILSVVFILSFGKKNIERKIPFLSPIIQDLPGYITFPLYLFVGIIMPQLYYMGKSFIFSNFILISAEILLIIYVIILACLTIIALEFIRIARDADNWHDLFCKLEKLLYKNA